MLIYTSIYNLINLKYLNIYIKHKGFRRRQIFERNRKIESKRIEIIIDPNVFPLNEWKKRGSLEFI